MVAALIMRLHRLKERSPLCGGGMSGAKNCSDPSTRFVIESILTVRDVRKNMARRTIAAKNMQAIVDDSFLRRSSRFASDDRTDEKLRTRFFELLARTPTYSLLQHLMDAIDAGNFACAENIRFEFQCREDRQQYAATFDMILDKHAFRDPVEMRGRIANIRKVADDADARITDLLRRCAGIESANG